VTDVATQALDDHQQEPQQLISLMTNAVHQFVGDAEQSDDLTMMGIQFIKKTKNDNNSIIFEFK
jgi:sigma-B regulation protein RsbU (phosphoserine phosphatase)